MFESKSVGADCECEVDEYHRLISEEDDSSSDVSFLDLLLKKKSLLQLPIQKIMKNVNNISDNTSESSTLISSPMTSRIGLR